MNAESSRPRFTGTTSSDISAIWPGALLVVYLGATGILLVMGRARVTPPGFLMHFSVLAAIGAATWLPMAPRWLQRWAPLLVLLFLYAEMPMLIRAVGHSRFFDPVVMSWERTLFGSQAALEWSARWPSRVLSELLHGAYLCYYAIIVSVPAVLELRRRRAEFSEAVFALMLTFVTCFALYVLFPVAGPRYLWPSPATATSGPLRTAVLYVLETGSSRGTAFPSSHVAVAVTQAILAVRYFGKRGLWIAALGLGLALGAIYGGFHYATDVIAGGALGVITTFAGLALFAQLTRRTSGYAKASPPT